MDETSLLKSYYGIPSRNCNILLIMDNYSTPVSPQSVFRPCRSDDWHEYRETIEQLYRDDQLKLRDVKRIMERNYMFFASYCYPFLLLQHLHSNEYASVFIPYRSPPCSQYYLTPSPLEKNNTKIVLLHGMFERTSKLKKSISCFASNRSAPLKANRQPSG